MEHKNMVVFDLEWNGGVGGVKLNEILEIGAVKLEGIGGPVVDTFRAFVKPAVHRTFNAAAKDLALSRAELAQGSPFPVVLERFLDWCGGDCAFASWGPHDLKELHLNAAYWDLSPDLPQTACDLQAAAGLAAGARGNVALHAMADYFGVPDALDFHDALNDAFYAAVVGGMAAARGGEGLLELCWSPAPLDLRRISAQDIHPHVLQTGARCGGFPREAAVLNGKAIRRQRCPACGRTLTVTCWFPMGEHRYMARAACPEHGHHYFWATTSQSGTGSWRGRVRTLKTDPFALALYGVRDKDKVIQCRRSRRRKRRRRPSGALAAQELSYA